MKRMSSNLIHEISRLLVAIEELIPVEFSRKTRTLDKLSRFKETEFRLRLFYVLPLILENRLPDVHSRPFWAYKGCTYLVLNESGYKLVHPGVHKVYIFFLYTFCIPGTRS
jgi:hypothetical protein